jgi:hypothetical protein
LRLPASMISQNKFHSNRVLWDDNLPNFVSQSEIQNNDVRSGTWKSNSLEGILSSGRGGEFTNFEKADLGHLNGVNSFSAENRVRNPEKTSSTKWSTKRLRSQTFPHQEKGIEVEQFELQEILETLTWRTMTAETNTAVWDLIASLLSTAILSCMKVWKALLEPLVWFQFQLFHLFGVPRPEVAKVGLALLFSKTDTTRVIQRNTSFWCVLFLKAQDTNRHKQTQTTKGSSNWTAHNPFRSYLLALKTSVLKVCFWVRKDKRNMITKTFTVKFVKTVDVSKLLTIKLQKHHL